ncbi:F-box/kelch-repeat protein At3g23880-like [Papaver somniferum]|uniref:F-box/kelch-repeat protein At3g23880-like n=1 Tax=Papaver somniferum TaxID=3469 RepID=UPI000E6F6C7B|nr:F-box/kelch-repeat protein At3g23880-like [Papaver somniferum]
MKKIKKDFDMGYFNKLPGEIALEILIRVPSETVLDCKLVCKSWRNLLSIDPSFPPKHLYHLNHPSTAAEDSCKLGFLALIDNNRLYFFEYNDDQNHELRKPIERIKRMVTTPIKGSRFIGSCNGLICLVGEEHDIPVRICNPFTKEYVNLPEIRIDGDDLDFCTFGFGYLPSTNEYKVVAVHVFETELIEVHIYTLGSGNGWRNLGKFNSEFSPMYNQDQEHGSFVNGSIYWAGANLNTILTFDLIEEKFCKHLEPPPLPLDTDLQSHTIGVLDGSLYISILDEEERGFDVWLLKKKNDKHEKKGGGEHRSLEWSKEFRANANHALALTKKGDVLTYCTIDNDLNIYDTKASTSKGLVHFEELVCRVFPHNNTFVSLKELGEKDAEIVSLKEYWEKQMEIKKAVNRALKELREKDAEIMKSVNGGRKP